MPELIDVAIGTIFVFLLFSLVVSALNEYILSLLDQRAKFLRLGLAEMLGRGALAAADDSTKKAMTGLEKDWAILKKGWKHLKAISGLSTGAPASLSKEGTDLLNHGLINAFSRTDADGKSTTPSYIPAGAFVSALLDNIMRLAPAEAWAQAHSTILKDLLTKAKVARETPDGSYDAVVAGFTAAFAALGAAPAAGSVLEKVNRRVLAGAARSKAKADLVKAADFAAAQAVIDASGPLKAELDLLVGKAAGDFAAFKASLQAWFTPAAELAALETEAAAAIADAASATIKAGLEALTDNPKLKNSLQCLLWTVEGDVRKFKIAVEGWFNGVMDRVSGWYKRFAQKWMIFIGLILAASFNVDTLEIVRVLSNNPNLAKAVANQAAAHVEENKDNRPLTAGELDEVRKARLAAVASTTAELEKQDKAVKDAADAVKNAADEAAKKTAADTLAEAQKSHKAAQEAFDKAVTDADAHAKFKESVARLAQTSIPMGWTPEVLKKLGVEKTPEGGLTVPVDFQLRVFISMIAGWFLTAIAASVGAPFWFDLLGRFVNIRAAGKAPGEKETTSTPTSPPPSNIDTTPATR